MSTQTPTTEVKSVEMPNLTTAQKITGLVLAIPAVASFLESFGVYNLSEKQVSSLQDLLLLLVIPALGLLVSDAGLRAARNARVAKVETAQIHADAAVAAAAAGSVTNNVVNTFETPPDPQTTLPDTAEIEVGVPVEDADVADPEADDALEGVDLPDEDDVQDQTTRLTPDTPKDDLV